MTDAISNINAPSLLEYFREQVRGAMEHYKEKESITTPDGVEFYLVNLLQGYLLTQEAFPEPTSGFKEEPLAFLYIKACQADSEMRISLLKRLGDFSLFMTGFFPESVSRRLVDLNYYIQMGESAYGSLSQMLARRAALAEIFGELAQRFVIYVDILTEVSEKSHLWNNRDLLRLYEHWLQTGSERAASLLSQAGIQPVRNPSKSSH